ncbi:MAG: hypothetical protein U0166_10750 [Acidobacteriota bacterium]
MPTAAGAEDATGAEVRGAAAQAQQAEVAGSTAEVRDEDELLVIELRLVLVRGADGLERDVDFREPGEGQSGAQPPLGAGVVVGSFGPREVDGPPDHDPLAEAAELRLGLDPELAQDDGDELLERVAVAEHRRRDHVACEERLQRLHEPAVPPAAR